MKSVDHPRRPGRYALSVLAGVLVLITGGCHLTTAGTTSPTVAGPAPSVTVPTTDSPRGTGSCHARSEGGYPLPDPACTPGVAGTEVTQANIHDTICVEGWTRSVRPPASYTHNLKRSQMVHYGETGSMRDYEEDHLIPLELGGSPTDPRNLWPQPAASPNPKDDVEHEANRAVCEGRMSLEAAQQQIAADWVTLGRRLGTLGR